MVGPPLSASAPSLASIGLPLVPTWSPLTNTSKLLSAVMTSWADFTGEAPERLKPRRKYRVPTGAAVVGSPSGYQIQVPVIASGGVGTLEHMAEGVLEGKADAVLAASIFHFGEYRIGEVKAYMKSRGIEVRD